MYVFPTMSLNLISKVVECFKRQCRTWHRGFAFQREKIHGKKGYKPAGMENRQKKLRHYKKLNVIIDQI